MLRRITGFHQDDAGEWVAELSCLHGQHVRTVRRSRSAPHRPGQPPAASPRRRRPLGCRRVIEGAIGFVMDAEPALEVRLGAGESQAIPPGVAHHLVVDGPSVVAVDFLVRPTSSDQAG